MIGQAKHILKSVFGYEDFIFLQEAVIENVLRGRDTLAVMPTGGGKSLCYQIPALIFEGLTIVVSPLISLMKDQVEQLAELRVPAVLLNSTLSPEEYRSNVEGLRRREAGMLYVAPETLLKPNVCAIFQSVPVACLAIDEAHCISEWGPDFRPEYRLLAKVRTSMPQAVCLALTATATPRVRQDIKTNLGFDDSSEFVASFNRKNLLIRFVPKDDPFRQAVSFLGKFPNESGIIYCLTRRQVDELCLALDRAGFSVCPYHAGLSESERNQSQDRFVRDEVRIIVATIAFGMGINKSNIRFVLHYDLPKNIENYYQEVGRAGRDGLPAECLLLFSYGDIHKIKYFHTHKEGVDQVAANLRLNAMIRLVESESCRRIPLLTYFGEAFSEVPCGMCDNCLVGEREATDATIPAQKFLSCVKRSGECFGANHIIDILLGSRSRRILGRRHNELSTYGIGREYSRKQWQQLARQLLHRGLLDEDADFGGLSLTALAWDVLKGRERFLCCIDARREEIRLPEEEAREGSPGCHRELFELLRLKRKELADAAKVPPYVIVSDRTLVEMATYLPQTTEDMLAIHGIGEAKFDRYGAIFITIIEGFCRARSLETIPHRSIRPIPSARGPAMERRHVVVGDAYYSGKSVTDLAREFGVKEATILNHLFRYFQAGYALRPADFKRLPNVSDEHCAKAMAMFEQFGPQYLRPVFEALKEEVSYDDLQWIRLLFLNDHHRGEPVPASRVPLRHKPREIVCLANSRKYSGYCFAGKEVLSDGIGSWIRPVSGEATGELSAGDIEMENGEPPRLLDVISISLKGSCPRASQTENFFAGGERWVRKGSFPFGRLPDLCDDADRLWIDDCHSSNGRHDRIPIDLTMTLSSSLLFIQTENLVIVVGQGIRGLQKVWAEFVYKGETYRLTVTDPAVESRHLPLASRRYPVESVPSYMTVSISEPFEGFCYKLAAAIIVPPIDRISEASGGEPMQGIAR